MANYFYTVRYLLAGSIKIELMEINVIQIGGVEIAEVVSDTMVIGSADDGLDLLGNLYYRGFDKIMLYEKNITPDFFNLRTGIAGEILQKFSTYRVQLAIIGAFAAYQSKSLNDFIVESNNIGHINFVKSKDAAVEKLAK
ncbi:DUF4180 domain-containing protein [Spirosoma sp. SC4-14]|uniref:DUF4180 domain-containing protein n=1 Tax=Spirosoma sp. SC4-14 TaxID=3128900 RepID=UPI0030CD9B4B